MKLINILEAIANNNLKDKTRLKVCSSSNREAFILEFDISYPGILWCIDENDETCKFNYHIDFMRILNYEVTIIEGGFIEEGSEDEEIIEWSNFAIKGMKKEKNLSGIKKYIETIMRTQNEIIEKINKD